MKSLLCESNDCYLLKLGEIARLCYVHENFCILHYYWILINPLTHSTLNELMNMMSRWKQSNCIRTSSCLRYQWMSRSMKERKTGGRKRLRAYGLLIIYFSLFYLARIHTKSFIYYLFDCVHLILRNSGDVVRCIGNLFCFKLEEFTRIENWNRNGNKMNWKFIHI